MEPVTSRKTRRLTLTGALLIAVGALIAGSTFLTDSGAQPAAVGTSLWAGGRKSLGDSVRPAVLYGAAAFGVAGLALLLGAALSRRKRAGAVPLPAAVTRVHATAGQKLPSSPLPIAIVAPRASNRALPELSGRVRRLAREAAYTAREANGLLMESTAALLNPATPVSEFDSAILSMQVYLGNLESHLSRIGGSYPPGERVTAREPSATLGVRIPASTDPGQEDSTEERLVAKTERLNAMLADLAEALREERDDLRRLALSGLRTAGAEPKMQAWPGADALASGSAVANFVADDLKPRLLS